MTEAEKLMLDIHFTVGKIQNKDDEAWMREIRLVARSWLSREDRLLMLQWIFVYHGTRFRRQVRKYLVEEIDLLWRAKLGY